MSAELHQYVAIYNADVASYRQTVLTAFQQVEDYLAQNRILSQQIQQQRGAVASSQTALDLEMGRYQTGIDPYIDVATLQTPLLSNQQQLASLQIEQMTGAVELVQALGGGWDFATTHAAASDCSAQQSRYQDSAVERLECLNLLNGSLQPQSDSVMRWRKPELVSKSLAAGALDRMKSSRLRAISCGLATPAPRHRDGGFKGRPAL